MRKENDGMARLLILGAFLITYMLWGSIDIANQFGHLMYGTPVSMVFFFLGGWAPTVMGIVCARKYRMISGPKDLLRDCFHLKQSPASYVTVVLLLAAYYAVLILTGCTTTIGPWYMWILSIPITVIFGGLEELGWRYILQPELEKKFSFIVATAIVGVIWSFWHLPLYFIVDYESISHFPAFAIDTVGFAFALAAVRKISKGIWPCILLHALLNAGSRVFEIKESIQASVIQLVVMISMSLVIMVIYKKKN